MSSFNFAQLRQLIEKERIAKIGVAAVLLPLTLLSACGYRQETTAKPEPIPIYYEAETTPAPKPAPFNGPGEELPAAATAAPVLSLEEAVSRQHPWADYELHAIAQTLAGECYDDKVEDKRKVCEVILNRVSDGNFGGGTILAVLTARNPVQFDGYWEQSRIISENDLEVAGKALQDWYINGCEPFSEYRYFSAGPNRENIFS